MNTARIPIWEGFSVQLKNGRAVAHGRDDTEAVELVQWWLRENKGHHACGDVENWLQQKQAQIRDEVEVHAARSKRAEVNAHVDEIARKGNMHDKKMIDLLRYATHEIEGTSNTED